VSQEAQASVHGGKEYIRALRQYHVPLVSTLSEPIVASQSGDAYEVRGSLNGIVSQGTGYTLLVHGDNGGSYSVSGAGATPEVVMGSRIRVLLADPSEGAPGQGGCKVVAVALDNDVEAATPRPAPRPTAARKPAARSRAPLASRGMTTQRAPSAQVVTSAGVFDAYKNAIHYFNSRLSEEQLNTITSAILGYSVKYGVDARLVMAVVASESSFRLGATSRTGAMGLGQLMPGTARGLGVANPYDPVQNLKGAVRLIRGHLDSHAGKGPERQLALALASYNAGSGAVRKYGGVPPYRETRNYIAKVSAWYRQFLGQ
jgi:hypothetical protein